MLGKKLLIAALGAAMLLASAAPAVAAPRRGCARRIHQAERNLDQAVRRHGPHSRQAQERRRQLEHARANCGAFRYAERGRW